MRDLKLVKKFEMTDGFFGRYGKMVKDVVLSYQENALNDRIEGAEKTESILCWILRVWTPFNFA